MPWTRWNSATRFFIATKTTRKKSISTICQITHWRSTSTTIKDRWLRMRSFNYYWPRQDKKVLRCESFRTMKRKILILLSNIKLYPWPPLLIGLFHQLLPLLSWISKIVHSIDSSSRLLCSNACQSDRIDDVFLVLFRIGVMFPFYWIICDLLSSQSVNRQWWCVVLSWRLSRRILFCLFTE